MYLFCIKFQFIFEHQRRVEREMEPINVFLLLLMEHLKSKVSIINVADEKRQRCEFGRTYEVEVSSEG